MGGGEALTGDPAPIGWGRRLLFSDRGRVARCGVVVLLLVASGVYADRMLGAAEPAIADLLADPDRHDGERVYFITHRAVDVVAGGFELDDRGRRLRVVAEGDALAGVRAGTAVSVVGRFRATSPPGVMAEQVVPHPLRPWKTRLSGVAAVLLAGFFLRVFTWRDGAFRARPRCRTW